MGRGRECLKSVCEGRKMCEIVLRECGTGAQVRCGIVRHEKEKNLWRGRVSELEEEADHRGVAI